MMFVPHRWMHMVVNIGDTISVISEVGLGMGEGKKPEDFLFDPDESSDDGSSDDWEGSEDSEEGSGSGDYWSGDEDYPEGEYWSEDDPDELPDDFWSDDVLESIV